MTLISMIADRRLITCAAVTVFLLAATWHESSRGEFAIDVARYGQVGDTIACSMIKDTVAGWERRREKAIDQTKRQIRTYDTMGRNFFQYNWEPVVVCAYERRTRGEGGKWICNPEDINHPALVYNLDDTNQFAFERSMRELLGPTTEIHTFGEAEPSDVPPFVQYHQISAEKEHDARSFLAAAVAKLGHKGRTIDMLNARATRGNYQALVTALHNGVFDAVNQLLLRINLASFPFGERDGLTPDEVHRLLVGLNDADMEIFHKEPGTSATYVDACDYAFVKVKWKVQNISKEVGSGAALQ